MWAFCHSPLRAKKVFSRTYRRSFLSNLPFPRTITRPDSVFRVKPSSIFTRYFRDFPELQAGACPLHQIQEFQTLPQEILYLSRVDFQILGTNPREERIVDRVAREEPGEELTALIHVIKLFGRDDSSRSSLFNFYDQLPGEYPVDRSGANPRMPLEPIGNQVQINGQYVSARLDLRSLDHLSSGESSISRDI